MSRRKFIATAPRQEVLIKDNHLCSYEAVDNERLRYDKSSSFPIINVMNGYVESGDQVELLIITADYAQCYENYVLIQKQAEKLSQQLGVSEIKVTKINVAFSETNEEHLHVFERLIAHIQDGDRLCACITYGTKPTSILELMALNYGIKTCKNVAIDCIAYGEMDHETGKKKIYDVTSLFYMDQIVNELGQHGNKNSLSVIKSLLTD